MPLIEGITTKHLWLTTIVGIGGMSFTLEVLKTVIDSDWSFVLAALLIWSTMTYIYGALNLLNIRKERKTGLCGNCGTVLGAE